MRGAALYWCFAGCIIALYAADTHAGEEASPVGSRVMIKPGTPLEVRKQFSGVSSYILVFEVDYEAGKRLRLVDNYGTIILVSTCGVMSLEEAQKYYTALIRRDRNSAQGHAARGIARVAIGQDGLAEEALIDFEEAARLDPRNSTYRLFIAKIWFENGYLDRAMAAADEAIRLSPTDFEAYLKRAEIWSKRRDSVKAHDDTSEAIRLRPDFAPAYSNRAMVFLVKQQTGVGWDEEERTSALRDLEMAIRTNPKFAGAYVNRGCLRPRNKEFDLALCDLNEAIRLDSKLTAPYCDRGICWEAKKEYQKARGDYEQAVKLDPNSDAQGNLAWLLATCPNPAVRDGKRAIEAATQVCNLYRWQDPRSLDTLAAAHAEDRSFDEAAIWESRAIESLPGGDKRETDYRARLELYRRHLPLRQGMEVISERPSRSN